VRERSRVEVEFHVLLLSPLHPTCKLIYGYLVAVNLLATELTVNLMEVEAESTSQERVHLLDILTEFIDVASLSRIVTCTLDTTRSSLAALEAEVLANRK
jgi:hypothetical protein